MTSLQPGSAFALSLLAGVIAGGVLAAFNVTLLQPYVEALADIEIDELQADGEFDEEEFDLQLQSLYTWQTAGPVAMGIGAGAMVGVTYVLGKIKASPLKAAILIAGAAWLVLYVMPTVKYPADPQALFDPEAASSYNALLAGYTAVSGLSALGAVALFSRIKRKNKMFGAAALYLAIISIAYFVFPDRPDVSYVTQQLLNAWKAAIAAATTAFWFVLGVISGLLWTYGKKSAGRGI